MTNGEPLVVQVAIKPISTLTKPLRSVDIHTKEPQAAHKERTDSTVVPGRRGRRRGDARADARRAPTARSSAATTSTTSSAAIAAYRERIDGSAVPQQVPLDRRRDRGRSRSIGFMGAGKTRGAHGRRGARPSCADTDAADRGRARAGRSPSLRRARARPRFREVEERVVLGALDERRRRRARRRRGRARERIREALAGHVTVWCRVERGGRLGARRGHRPPAGRDRDAFRAPLRRSARPLYEEAADVDPAARRRRDAGRGRALARGAARAPRRCGSPGRAPAIGRVPGGRRRRARPTARLDGDAGCSARGCSRSPTRAALAAPACRARRSRARRSSSPAASSEDARRGRARCSRELAARGRAPRRRVVAFGGGVVGDLAGFCAAIYQRGIPVVQVPTTLVAQVDSALRRQDRRRPARRPRTTSAPTTSPPPCSPTRRRSRRLPAEELAAGFAEVVKTALIAGGALWERVRGGRRPPTPAAMATLVFDCARTKLEVVAEDERDGGRRAVLNLGHTVGHAIEAATRLRPLPPRRGGRARPARGAAALRRAASCATRSPTLLAARRAADRLDPDDRPRRGRRRDRPRQEADRRRARLRARPRARRRRHGQPVDEGDLRAAVEELRAMSPRRARTTASRSCTASTSTRSAAATPSVYGTFTLAELETQVKPLGARARPARRPSSRPTTRASSASTCTGCPSSPTRRSSTPAPGPTTRGRSATRSRSPACPPSRSTSPTSTSARTGARTRSSTASSLEKISGEGAEGYRRALEILKRELGA